MVTDSHRSRRTAPPAALEYPSLRNLCRSVDLGASGVVIRVRRGSVVMTGSGQVRGMLRIDGAFDSC